MADELILIVDDNEQNRKLARDVLQFAGFRTLEAAGGVEGLSLAVEHLPDLILMDIRMSDMNGTEAVRKLREDERTAAIRVVALTSSTMKGDRERFLADGFDGYLEKPIRSASSRTRSGRTWREQDFRLRPQSAGPSGRTRSAADPDEAARRLGCRRRAARACRSPRSCRARPVELPRRGAEEAPGAGGLRAASPHGRDAAQAGDPPPS